MMSALSPCTLQPLSGESLSGASAITEDGARLDIAANGFWGGRYERTYLDVRVFNPLYIAPSNRQQSLAATYRKHERVKIRAYEQRRREVEHGSFTPLVMSLTGGCGSAAGIYKFTSDWPRYWPRSGTSPTVPPWPG